MIPITTSQDFLNIKKGNEYILVNDIDFGGSVINKPILDIFSGKIMSGGFHIVNMTIENFPTPEEMIVTTFGGLPIPEDNEIPNSVKNSVNNVTWRSLNAFTNNTNGTSLNLLLSKNIACLFKLVVNSEIELTFRNLIIRGKGSCSLFGGIYNSILNIDMDSKLKNYLEEGSLIEPSGTQYPSTYFYYPNKIASPLAITSYGENTISGRYNTEFDTALYLYTEDNKDLNLVDRDSTRVLYIDDKTRRLNVEEYYATNPIFLLQAVPNNARKCANYISGLVSRLGEDTLVDINITISTKDKYATDFASLGGVSNDTCYKESFGISEQGHSSVSVDYKDFNCNLGGRKFESGQPQGVFSFYSTLFNTSIKESKVTGLINVEEISSYNRINNINTNTIHIVKIEDSFLDLKINKKPLNNEVLGFFLNGLVNEVVNSLSEIKRCYSICQLVDTTSGNFEIRLRVSNVVIDSYFFSNSIVTNGRSINALKNPQAYPNSWTQIKRWYLQSDYFPILLNNLNSFYNFNFSFIDEYKKLLIKTREDNKYITSFNDTLEVTFASRTSAEIKTRIFFDNYEYVSHSFDSLDRLELTYSYKKSVMGSPLNFINKDIIRIIRGLDTSSSLTITEDTAKKEFTITPNFVVVSPVTIIYLIEFDKPAIINEYFTITENPQANLLITNEDPNGTGNTNTPICRVGWSDQTTIENGIENGDTLNNAGNVTINNDKELVWSAGDSLQYLYLENQSLAEGESILLTGRFARGTDETYPNLLSVAVGTNNSQIVLFVIEPNVSAIWLGNNGGIIGAVTNSLVTAGDYYIATLQITRTASGIEILASDNGVSNLTPKPYLSNKIPFSTSNITFSIGGRNNGADQSWDGKMKDVVIAKRTTPYTQAELLTLTPEDVYKTGKPKQFYSTELFKNYSNVSLSGKNMIIDLDPTITSYLQGLNKLEGLEYFETKIEFQDFTDRKMGFINQNGFSVKYEVVKDKNPLTFIDRDIELTASITNTDYQVIKILTTAYTSYTQFNNLIISQKNTNANASNQYFKAESVISDIKIRDGTGVNYNDLIITFTKFQHKSIRVKIKTGNVETYSPYFTRQQFEENNIGGTWILKYTESPGTAFTNSLAIGGSKSFSLEYTIETINTIDPVYNPKILIESFLTKGNPSINEKIMGYSNTNFTSKESFPIGAKIDIYRDTKKVFNGRITTKNSTNLYSPFFDYGIDHLKIDKSTLETFSIANKTPIKDFLNRATEILGIELIYNNIPRVLTMDKTTFSKTTLKNIIYSISKLNSNIFFIDADNIVNFYDLTENNEVFTLDGNNIAFQNSIQVKEDINRLINYIELVFEYNEEKNVRIYSNQDSINKYGLRKFRQELGILDLENIDTISQDFIDRKSQPERDISFKLHTDIKYNVGDTIKVNLANYNLLNKYFKIIEITTDVETYELTNKKLTYKINATTIQNLETTDNLFYNISRLGKYF